MIEDVLQAHPAAYAKIAKATLESGFNMASDPLTCSLLRTLAASKPGGRFLELGTGTGLASSWILDGMDSASTLLSVDNDAAVLNIASACLGADERASFILSDGADWISANSERRFDYIFADTWHGKYLMLEEALTMLNCGGLYIIDDMLPQPNWPAGHHEKATQLIIELELREDLYLTKQSWATGIIIAVKK